ERDEAVMAEYHDVELAAWGIADDPVATDRLIVRRITAARAEVARLSSLRAHHLRRAWRGDGDRGWQTRAAQSLGTSPQAITKILAGDGRRASARRRAARLRGWLSGSGPEAERPRPSSEGAGATRVPGLPTGETPTPSLDAPQVCRC